MKIEDVKRVVVISLLDRPDRWQLLNEELEQVEWPLPAPERFPALSGMTLRRPAYWHGSGGAWGCLQSWRAVLSNLIVTRTSAALVLEDDVTFVPQFDTRLRHALAQVPANWQVVMLGGEHRARPRVITSNVVQVVAAARTHALLISHAGARELLRATLYCNDEVDAAFGAVQETGRVYAVDPFLIGQRAGLSDVNGELQMARFFNPV